MPKQHYQQHFEFRKEIEKVATVEHEFIHDLPYEQHNLWEEGAPKDRVHKAGDFETLSKKTKKIVKEGKKPVFKHDLPYQQHELFVEE